MDTNGSAKKGDPTLRKLLTPNMSPTKVPTNGPPIIAPIITGICIVVALIPKKGIGMNPIGVILSTTENAPSIPAIVTLFVDNFVL